MNIFTRIVKRSEKSKVEKRLMVTLLGPANAGKTTLIRYVETGKEVLHSPNSTLGIDIRNKSFYEDNSIAIKVIDTSGQEKLSQLLWETAIQHANAIIILIDATIKPNNSQRIFQSMIHQINYAFDIIPENQKIMLLLNKHDLTELNPIKKEEVIELYQLQNKLNVFDLRNFQIFEISAKYGTNVNDCIIWLKNQFLTQD